ncbi:glycine betaine/L-proline ABC transporter ATP-binding protein [Mesorhizobium sp. BR1-1-14]|uniref:quaternary amine ABC transporter ATP-binding protein n=1 Tax=Mesorhizobium sp. BR1-1-14 TaxID=2876655 RepID=UPI001CD18605|nr:glycine betaine/L-proline ABC transporter ATP-binding protein [Mesorhizobium sp. BR1-1-14]MBZ9957122.1 glycine betaine/L-proline ABC transporter ATP-binding protein [Mesorhizobium sp. BR1-1-14]
MTDRITVEGVYKIFGRSPESALAMLKSGETKEAVLQKTGQVVGLSDVSLSVPVGSIYMIMGLSGSGKSTLARCINRLIEPNAGRILIDGEEITGASEARLREIRRTRISMVFQHFGLLPNRTVLENAEFGLKLRGVPAAARRKKVMEVLEVVGLASWANHLPGTLSGGMRQRVGLARALATDADVLIMDEAFSALDPLIRSEMQDELLRLHRAFHKTILFITHDFQEALKLGSRVAIMADGMVMREGVPQDIVTKPGNDYVAAFTRDVNRAHLFDASSVMVESSPLRLDGRAFGGRDAEGEPVFIVDDSMQVVGVVGPRQLPRLADGSAIQSLMSKDYETVCGTEKLSVVASLCHRDRPIAVVDEGGRYLGRVDPLQILSRIGAPAAASSQSRGAEA